jgi:hypothetical protein
MVGIKRLNVFGEPWQPLIHGVIHDRTDYYARYHAKRWLEDPGYVERKREIARAHYHANKEKRLAYNKAWRAKKRALKGLV